MSAASSVLLPNLANLSYAEEAEEVGKANSSMDTTERTATSTLSHHTSSSGCESESCCWSKEQEQQLLRSGSANGGSSDEEEGMMCDDDDAAHRQLSGANDQDVVSPGVESLNASVLAAIVLMMYTSTEQTTNHPRAAEEKETTHTHTHGRLPEYLFVSARDDGACVNNASGHHLSQNSFSPSDTSSDSSSERSFSTDGDDDDTLMSDSSSERSSLCGEESEVFDSSTTSRRLELEDIFTRREETLRKLLKKARSQAYKRYAREQQRAARSHALSENTTAKAQQQQNLELQKCGGVLVSVKKDATRNSGETKKKSGGVVPPPTTEHEHDDESESSAIRRLIRGLWRCVLFELYHSVPAYITQILYCFAHIAFFEMICLVMGEHLGDIANEKLMYASVMALSLFLARISGSSWNWLNDTNYDFIKFEMRNKLYLRHADARLLLWFKRHDSVRESLEILSLYLCYYASYYFVGTLALQSFFDIKEDIVADLPSMQYPDVSTHIKDVLVKGELAFEDASSSAVRYVPGSSQCTALGIGGEDENEQEQQFCTQDVLDICNALEQFRANLTEADAEYLWEKTTVDSYYNVIGDVGAGIYNGGTVVCYFMAVSATCTFLLKKVGVGFWDR